MDPKDSENLADLTWNVSLHKELRNRPRMVFANVGVDTRLVKFDGSSLSRTNGASSPGTVTSSDGVSFGTVIHPAHSRANGDAGSGGSDSILILKVFTAHL